jgi:hypothetical protein
MSTRPRRCFIANLEQKENDPASCNTHATGTIVRIMGIVVSILPVPQNDACNGCGPCHDINNNSNSNPMVDMPTTSIAENQKSNTVGYQFVLDDGSGSVEIFVPRFMYQNLSVKEGQTLDCIVRKSHNSKTRSIQNFNDSAGKSSVSQPLCLDFWSAETLILVTDPHAESLRWMELCHDNDDARKSRSSSSSSSSSTNPLSNDEMRPWGYPSLPVNTTDEVYRFILNQATIDSGNDAGVSSEDLALVLHRPHQEVEQMIQELQIMGQIYQNARKLFVPL